MQNGSKLPARIPVWLPQAAETKRRHLSNAEFEKFFAGVMAEHAKLYVMLVLYSMARPTAILQLEWNRVDFMHKQTDFTPPGRIRRRA